ncbi:MAG TPA: hypothetical protein VN193_00425 [Candidatus Angelobacter sp.]|jgi:hypothetical protein|nr:hypothetical protein [Candidatus Angelobacter sp.]
MPLRSAIRGLLLGTVGALAALGLAAALNPQVRRRCLQLAGRTPEPEAQQPTHIVLPDRAIASWEGLDEAIEEGRQQGREVPSDVALAGA